MCFFFFQAEDGIRDADVTGVQTCALPIFPDEVIQTYLDVNDGNVKRAAAQACRALAVSEALISKVIKTEDLQTDGAKVANALLGVARDLEQSADRDDERDDNSAFDIIPFYPRPPIYWPR